MGSIRAKFEAFDWDVLKSKRKHQKLLCWMNDAKSRTGKGKPVCVLLHTEMGNGVDFMIQSCCMEKRLMMHN
jgi:transketolase